MKKPFLIINIFLTACNFQCTSDNTKDSKVDSEEISNRKKGPLDGVWAENEEENALFEISGDSLFYMENPESNAKFEIKDDSLIMYAGELTNRNLIIRKSKDSLIYKNETGNILRLYKR